MPHHPENSLSPKERVKLIAGHPLFCLLSPEDTDEMALLLKEQSCESGATIIEEGDFVDCFYFIVSGTAEITKTISTLEKVQKMHIATLTPGDTIGLADANLFARTGLRSATVTATADMVLFVLYLKDFNKFLQKPSVSYPGLQKISEKVLLMNFIKDVRLFHGLPNIKIQELSEKIKKITITKGTEIFKRGAMADKCYGILTGKVAITTLNENENYVIKVLESPNVFGEAAFLNNAKRNANAIAETDCELFVLEKDALKSDKLILESVSASRILQLRLIPSVVENRKLKIASIDYEIWKNSDGKKTLHHLIKENDILKSLSLSDVYSHVLKLQKKGFLQLSDNNEIVYPQHKNLLHRIVTYFGKRNNHE